MGLNQRDLDILRIGAMLHDVGKIFIPDAILKKEGRFTAEEFNIMKQHPENGAEWLETLDWKLNFIQIVRYHHERWDGNGYPNNLATYDIPLFARIIAVLDAYDAVRESRPYRKDLSRDEAVQIILDGRATWYDPVIVDLFTTFIVRLERTTKDHLLEFPLVGHPLSERASQSAPHRGLSDDLSHGDTEPISEVEEGRL